MHDFTYCKIEIFIPQTHLTPLREVLKSVDAGHIGSYDGCMAYSMVTGCWRPLPGSSPYSGAEHAYSEEPELKVEVVCLRENAEATIAAIKSMHPYDVPVIQAIPLYKTGY